MQRDVALMVIGALVMVLLYMVSIPVVEYLKERKRVQHDRWRSMEETMTAIDLRADEICESIVEIEKHMDETDRICGSLSSRLDQQNERLNSLGHRVVTLTKEAENG